MTSWDAYDAYLFDIDGTLLNATDAVHYFAFCDALTKIAGRPVNLDGVTAHGNVDNGILRDAFALAKIPNEQWRPRLLEIQHDMCRFVAQRQAEFQLTALPGAVEVLSHLCAKGAILGVATGNLEGIGQLKLGHAGLLNCFHFGGYSDAYESRCEVFRAAARTARSLTSPTANLCVIGDTPTDIHAAQSNELDVIAVATGVFSLDTLREHNPTRAISTLSDLLDLGV